MNGRNTPILGYLQSAVADNTAHGSIDRLLLEDEMNNQPKHSMRAPDYGTNIFGQKITEPYEFKPEDFSPIGAVGSAGKASKGIMGLLKSLGKKGKEKNILKQEELAKYSFPDYAGKPLEMSSKEMSNVLEIMEGRFPRGTVVNYPKIGSQPAYKATVSPSGRYVPEGYQQGGQAQLMGEQGNPDNPQRWIRKNYNEDGSIASTSFVGEPQQKNKAQAHRNLLMEALSQPPQHTMGVPDEPWPMPEDIIPIGGAMRLLKSSGKYLDMLKSVSKTAAKEKKNWETMTDLTRGGSKGQIKETPKEFLKWYKKGADKSGEEYLTTKWIQKILDQNPF